MKFKVFITAAIMLAACGLANAGDGPMFGTPRGGVQALASADYGGVSYSTNCVFTTNFSTVVIPVSTDRKKFLTGVFYGVMFSSGNAGSYDFVDVWDSTSADIAGKTTAFMRLYNVSGSTNTSFANAAAASGFSGPPKPIRFNAGLIIRASVSTYNMITALFYREP